MTPQNKIAKRVFDYWSKVFYDTKKDTVVCDQGNSWGAKKHSNARSNISLFVGEIKNRDSQMSQADLAVINKTTSSVPFL